MSNEIVHSFAIARDHGVNLTSEGRRDYSSANSADPPSDFSEPSGRLFAHREGPDD
ncbi:hypothetical protein [Rathayibacter sp. PhB151]|uniref:hypothetical protein n=1 Tax=Rathayibacter sp. PhB151 TaxID=2485189 RepID=UPI001416F5CD|nr:hypothetical protein [Rathayibacter sp. PhB151]